RRHRLAIAAWHGVAVGDLDDCQKERIAPGVLAPTDPYPLTALRGSGRRLPESVLRRVGEQRKASDAVVGHKIRAVGCPRDGGEGDREGIFADRPDDDVKCRGSQNPGDRACGHVPGPGESRRRRARVAASNEEPQGREECEAFHESSVVEEARPTVRGPRPPPVRSPSPTIPRPSLARSRLRPHHWLVVWSASNSSARWDLPAMTAAKSLPSYRHHT